MKLNGLACGGFVARGKAEVEFSLTCTLAEATALDGQTLTVTEDDGTTQVAVFSGFAVTGVWRSTDTDVRVRAARELEDTTKQAIEGIEGSIEGVRGIATGAQSAADTANDTVSAVAQAVAELGVTVSETNQSANDTASAVAELGVIVAGLQTA